MKRDVDRKETADARYLTQVIFPTHPQYISHRTALSGGADLWSWSCFGSCASYVANHLD